LKKYHFKTRKNSKKAGNKMEEKINFKSFMKKNYIIIILIFIAGLLIYGFKLTHYSISIDTEVIINNYDAMMNSWLSIGRFSLIFIKWIFHLNPFNAMFATWTMIICFVLSVILLIYIFYKISKGKINSIQMLLFGLMILTSPIFAEQFNFLLQSAEVAFTMILLNIGLYFFYKGITKNRLYFIITIIFFAFCYGCYQAFVPLSICLLMCIGFIRSEEDTEVKNNIKYFIITILIVICSLVLYQVISKLVLNYFQLETSSYLTDQILWFKDSKLTVLYNLIKYAGKVLIGYGNFYNLGYGIALLLIVMYLIKNKINKKNISSIFYLLAIIISPFLLSLLTGQAETIRAQFALPFSIAFICCYLYDQNIIKNKIKHTVLILLILSQFLITIQLFYSDYIRYQEDVLLAEQIMEKITPLLTEEKRVVFLNTYSHDEKLITKGETMGYSFFEWDKTTEIGVNGRVTGFLGTLGYHLTYPTIEDVKKAKELELEMETWPNQDSILEYDNLIIIRLS